MSVDESQNNNEALLASHRALFPHMSDMYLSVLTKRGLGLPDQYHQPNAMSWAINVLKDLDSSEHDFNYEGLWAVSGTLRGCSDETFKGVLVRARVAELWERERDHHCFLNGLWTKFPKKYADPDWSGRLSPTVTYYTEAPSEDTDDDTVTDPDACTDQDIDLYDIISPTLASTKEISSPETEDALSIGSA
ncbi:hypothetical protein FPOAC1_008886 [Fusarium poae]|uniref:hypothetical protein n=1 Tax=Fusarium poae TaxID=36050 RepID=UPI001CEACAFC|nr:hypothetical protein FPOAC1_008886 [Fusarium poae]KAG8669491.1 hypothetical protein FPOAC1_008886 [Fusarium poae]